MQTPEMMTVQLENGQTQNPAANKTATQLQTQQAIQSLATYFSIDFALRDKPKSAFSYTLGYISSLIWAQPKYQGFENKLSQYQAAQTVFLKAKSAITSVASAKLDETAKTQLNTTLGGILSEAPGNRFPVRMTEWLNASKNKNLPETKEFIAETQKIFQEYTLPMISIGVTDSGTTFAKTTADDPKSAYIRGESYFSIFEAMGDLAAVDPKHRPTLPPNDIKLATLLSNIKQQPNPSEIRAIRALYAMLDLYPTLHRPLYDAAAKKDSKENPSNFPLHCAILQALLLTYSSKNEGDLTDVCKNHWKENKNPLFATFIKSDFMNARKGATPFTVEGKRFTKQLLNEHIPAFLKNEEQESRKKLLACIISYVDGLSAQLQSSLNQYSDDADVVKTFDPFLAKEVIQTIRSYVNSPEFQKALGVEFATIDFSKYDMVDDDEPLADQAPDINAGESSVQTNTPTQSNAPVSSSEPLQTSGSANQPASPVQKQASDASSRPTSPVPQETSATSPRATSPVSEQTSASTSSPASPVQQQPSVSSSRAASPAPQQTSEASSRAASPAPQQTAAANSRSASPAPQPTASSTATGTESTAATSSSQPGSPVQTSASAATSPVSSPVQRAPEHALIKPEPTVPSVTNVAPPPSASSGPSSVVSFRGQSQPPVVPKNSVTQQVAPNSKKKKK